MADGEMMIGVGSWTDLSTDARAVLVFRPYCGAMQIAYCAANPLALQ